jgi:NAD+ synthase
VSRHRNIQRRARERPSPFLWRQACTSTHGSVSEVVITRLEEALRLDPNATIDTLAERLRTQVGEVLHRRGLVVAMSGGVDSSVCAGLAVRALGPDRVFGLLMPERESGGQDTSLALQWAQKLGIEHVIEDITQLLSAAGTYRRRDDAIRALVPEYGDGWRCRISLGQDRLAMNRLAVFFLVVQSPGGETQKVRLSPQAYREIVAATNFKQRSRKMLEYYHADRLHYAVVGTPNRLEYDQGFFVKGGDGLADVKPIAHLYKTQVYQLARALGVPEGITQRAPTTATYSLEQGQDEFYFSLPLQQMDRALYAHDHRLGAELLAKDLGISVDEASSVLRDIDRKRAGTKYLHQAALLIEPVESIG